MHEIRLHTWESREDITRVAQLVLNVQWFEKWVDPEAGDDGTLRVYAVSDDEWIKPSRICNFATIANRMLHYRRTAADTENLGCIVLLDPDTNIIHLSIMDAKIPALCLIWHLKRRGWRPVDALVEHRHAKEDDETAVFDGFEACSKNI